MDFSDSYKKYFLYSISLHAIALILLLLFGDTTPPPPVKTTQVTMVRLTRMGDPRGSLFAKPPPAEKPAAPQPAAPPQPPPPVPVAKPAPIEPMAPPPKPAKPASPAEPKPTVHLGQEKKPAPKPSPAKPAPATPVVPAAKPRVPAPNEAKISEALAGIQTELKERETAAQPAAPTGVPGGTGTGQVPAFGSPAGDVNATDPGYAQYQSAVRSKIIRQWISTGGAPQGEQAIRARIQVRINASGQVISKHVVRGSGNESFDLSALRAIERASPLPPPPEGIKAEALSEGFVVDFSSRMLGRR
ncbi:TonB family protein [Deltaproteobacteria bacterium PRO3]|nr:TonB family protein [Deltaproteobacteria bacterium PRO3]